MLFPNGGIWWVSGISNGVDGTMKMSKDRQKVSFWTVQFTLRFYILPSVFKHLGCSVIFIQVKRAIHFYIQGVIWNSFPLCYVPSAALVLREYSLSCWERRLYQQHPPASGSNLQVTFSSWCLTVISVAWKPHRSGSIRKACFLHSCEPGGSRGYLPLSLMSMARCC